jgi:aminoglycoside phosphotransferase (APT) family kinase protein
MDQPGRRLASGRDSDIFEYGEGLVLRRSRRGRSMAEEAAVMEHARSHGYPVPFVSEVSDDGTALVMQRVAGPSMGEALARRPWEFGRQAKLLGHLHHRLHDIAAPPWMRPAPGPEGDRVVHLDLHPMNVLLGEHGPVVIDWANAARGRPEVDVGLTWILLAAGEIPVGRVRAAVMGRFRALFVRLFLRGFDVAAIAPYVRSVVEWKVRDPNMSADEQAGMWRVVGELEAASPAP